MKRLILMRHAKSSWAEAGLDDHERALNDRGRQDAPRMGQWIAEHGGLPDAALVSSAARTRETWDLLGAAFGEVEAALREELYHAEPGAMLAVLQAAPEAAGRVLMLGHMPGIGRFARMLLARAPEVAGFDKYPTAAAAVIDVAVGTWAEVDFGAGELVAFGAPKGLG